MDIKPYKNPNEEGEGGFVSEPVATQKHINHHVTSGKSDEELAAILASTSDWDEAEHADLSQIDYSKYKSFQSNKVKKVIEKWL